MKYLPIAGSYREVMESEKNEIDIETNTRNNPDFADDDGRICRLYRRRRL